MIGEDPIVTLNRLVIRDKGRLTDRVRGPRRCTEHASARRRISSNNRVVTSETGRTATLRGLEVCE